MKNANEVLAGKTLQEIEIGLRLSGGLTETARLNGRSLTGKDREFVLHYREAAHAYGLSINMQTTIEQEGAAIVRQAVRS